LGENFETKTRLLKEIETEFIEIAKIYDCLIKHVFDRFKPTNINMRISSNYTAGSLPKAGSLPNDCLPEQ
ncbi:hypothetical protein K8I31_02355, partial [bacterium]|nr:hypothetical protein [bacterium]